MKKNLKNFLVFILFTLFFEFKILAKNSDFLIPEIEKLLYERNNSKLVEYKIFILSPKFIEDNCIKPKLYMTNYININNISIVNIQCTNKKYIFKINIKSYSKYYKSSVLIKPKTTIKKTHIHQTYGEITNLPNDLVLSNYPIIGTISTRLIGVGQPVTFSMIRDPWNVHQGDKIFIELIGNGFRIRYYGIAMKNAVIGDILKVKLPSGKFIQGILNSDNMLVFNIK
ncbi:FlgA family flagellar basal-body P-ring formation protein [Wigglesworthia glossinidia endosymbiont of Glossina morsitans morsitans (Yale colony)]|uniref:Flagella basal body P-ring formation protein FlgA n=1 Tax=Wigglesworthia glossinidia endosymbiont of Glossina morsitans morsitans (Yale colony) TaxID=1142511 RepID=H6Q4B8_WIGGL|nr:flagellar basal body P-ring formation chaperone FlgA [Wigglesworthia glossinidia]AFA40901.1 FlgA family flagellar basal-body P-ring formation protein [Wigglesworthia glossinidia endosymbiont of Glossina morsitans morsitans (Yale colony)]